MLEVRCVGGHEKCGKKQKVKKAKDLKLTHEAQTEYLLIKGKNKNNIMIFLCRELCTSRCSESVAIRG